METKHFKTIQEAEDWAKENSILHIIQPPIILSKTNVNALRRGRVLALAGRYGVVVIQAEENPQEDRPASPVEALFDNYAERLRKGKPMPKGTGE